VRLAALLATAALALAGCGAEPTACVDHGGPVYVVPQGDVIIVSCQDGTIEKA
jgi:hypothetical protein